MIGQDDFCKYFMKNYIPEKLYLCDPSKNKECRKTCCYEHNLNPQNGVCKYTRDPAFRKNGKVFAYDLETKEYKEVIREK